jgi:hypothetical protein
MAIHVTDLCNGDNVKNAENNTPTTAIYLYDLVFKHWNRFSCYVMFCHIKINTQMNNNWMQSIVKWSKMNILFIYTCTNLAQILTFCLYIKMATYKCTKQTATQLKQYSPDFSTFFHMPFKDHISDLSQIITQHLSSDKNN